MSGIVSFTPDRGWFEAARTVAFGAVLDAYSAIGTAIEHPTRVFIIWNLTNANAYISIDGVLDYWPIVAGGHLILDDSTNGISLPKGTTFYVKRYTAGVAPTSGDVVVSIGYKV